MNFFYFKEISTIINEYFFQVLRTYEGHEYPVHLLLPFGNHLISVDTDSNVKVWDIHSEGEP